MEINFPEMFQIVDFILKMGTIVHSCPHIGLGGRSCSNIHSISRFCHEMVEP